jgi:hypothetical protein
VHHDQCAKIGGGTNVRDNNGPSHLHSGPSLIGYPDIRFIRNRRKNEMNTTINKHRKTTTTTTNNQQTHAQRKVKTPQTHKNTLTL